MSGRFHSARSWLLASGGSLALCTIAAAREDKVLLSPRFEAGTSHYCEWDQSTVSTRIDAGPDQEPARRFRQIIGIMETVESVAPDGTVTLRLTIDRAVHEFRSGAILQKFDSDIEDSSRSDHPLAKLLGPLIGASMRMKVDREGHILEFQGLTSTFETISRQIENDPARATLESKLQRLKYTFGEASARVMWGEARFAMYAYKEVQAGDRWERTLMQPFPTGELEIKLQMRVDKVEPHADSTSAQLDYEAVLTQKTPATPPSGQEGFATDFSGSFKGHARFDSREGQFEQERETGVMRLTVPSQDPRGPATMKLEQKTETVTRRMSAEERQKQKLEALRPRRK